MFPVCMLPFTGVTGGNRLTSLALNSMSNLNCKEALFGETAAVQLVATYELK